MTVIFRVTLGGFRRHARVENRPDRAVARRQGAAGSAEGAVNVTDGLLPVLRRDRRSVDAGHSARKMLNRDHRAALDSLASNRIRNLCRYEFGAKSNRISSIWMRYWVSRVAFL